MPRTHALTTAFLLGAATALTAAPPLSCRTHPVCDRGHARFEHEADSPLQPESLQQVQLQKTGSQDKDKKSRAMRLRAAYVSKIAAYIAPRKKSNDAKAPYVIAVVGTDAFADAILKLLPGKSIHKRKVKVVVIDPTLAATAKKHEHQLLYVAKSVEPAVAERIIKSHAKLATPLMSARKAFASKGGGVQLFIKNNKVKFEVNNKALKAQGMKASPQLLKLSSKGPTK